MRPIHIILAVLGIGLVSGLVVSMPLVGSAQLTLLDISVVVVLLAVAVAQGRKRYIPKFWAPIIGFVAVALTSLMITTRSVPLYVVGGGLLYIIRWFLYAALYWAASNAIIPSRLWVKTLMISGLGLAAIGIVQYVLYPDLRNLSYLGWDPHYQRLFSTLFDPNFTGIILSLTALTFLGLLPLVKKRGLYIAGLMLVTAALILTYSRSSLLAFFIGVGTWGMLTGRKALVAVFLAVVVVVLIVLPTTGEGTNLRRSVSSYARLGNAERAISLIREKPFFGHGFNILRFVATRRSWIDETTLPSRAGAGLDTSLLFVGSTTGIIGMLMYGWMLISLFRLGIRGLSRSGSIRDASALYVSALAAVVVHSLFVNSLFYPWVMAWAWIGTGSLEQLAVKAKVANRS